MTKTLVLRLTDFRANAIIHVLLVGIMGARDETNCDQDFSAQID